MIKPKLLPTTLRVLCIPLLLLSACSSLYTNTIDNLYHAILNHDDPKTVQESAPAYLLLIDALNNDNTNKPQLMQTGAKLYSAYTTIFITNDTTRAKRLSTRAFNYAKQALCAQHKRHCDLTTHPFDLFTKDLKPLNKPTEISSLYTLAEAWLVWIQAHRDQWDAIADLPKTEALLKHIVTVNEHYQQGSAHVALGVLTSLRPPALGGQPEVSRQHFERAIELSNGQNLMAKVQFAQNYARLVFDRTLHDNLLNEVLTAETKAPNQTLLNILAKESAQHLLDSADDYF